MSKFKINLFLCLLLAASDVFASGLGASAVRAEPISKDDLSWLKKMQLAAHHANYSGTFIYQSGNHIETSRITHVSDGENEHERLEGLDGERSEVIRKNDQIWCYQGENKVLVAKREGARMFPALLPAQLSLLQENYVMHHAEDDRVAGFHAHSIIFQPRDKMRYAHKMWAHSDSGLLLKAVVLDERNRVLELYAFTQLSIGGDIDRKWIVKSLPEDQASSVATVSDHGISTVPGESGWRVYALPAGFKKITEVSRRLKGSSQPVTHLVYSDGLAGISVFIEKLGDKSGVKQGLHNKGLIQFFTKVQDDNLLTVVGQVPSRTVVQVAKSVRFGGQK